MKPDNICLMIAETNGRPLWRRVKAMLGDWELSSGFEGDGEQLLRGTPGYWSPEQAPRAPTRGEESGFSSYWQDLCDDCPSRCSQLLVDLAARASDGAERRKECISAASDVWGFATCTLGLLGLLDTMRRDGFRAFVRALDPESLGWHLTTGVRLTDCCPRDRRHCSLDGQASDDGCRGRVLSAGTPGQSRVPGPWEQLRQRSGPRDAEVCRGGSVGTQPLWEPPHIPWRSLTHEPAWCVLCECLSLRPASRPPLAEAGQRLARHLDALEARAAGPDGDSPHQTSGYGPRTGAQGPLDGGGVGHSDAKQLQAPPDRPRGGEGGLGRERRALDGEGRVLEAAASGYRVCEELLGPADEQTWAAGWRLVAALCSRGDKGSLAEAEEVSRHVRGGCFRHHGCAREAGVALDVKQGGRRAKRRG